MELNNKVSDGRSDTIPPQSNTGGGFPEFEAKRPARLLLWGIDTVHYHISLDEKLLLECASACEEWIEDGHEWCFRGGMAGAQGYSYCVQFESGLRVAVPSPNGLHMGLWIVGGAGWCLHQEASWFEFEIVSSISSRFAIDPESVRAGLRVRRFDLYFDFAGDDLDPYANLDNIICYARKHRQLHGDTGPISVIPGTVYGSITRFTGVTAGKSDLRARLYDKVVEAERGTLDRWRKVWNYQGDTVWRLEYQVRGDFLKDWQIDTMKDVVVKLGDLVPYLLRWMRFAEVQSRKDVDRTLLPWWASIVATIEQLDLSSIGVRRVVPPRLPDEDGLKAQTLGLISSLWAAHAFTRSLDWDYGQALSFLLDVLDEESVTLKQRFHEKITTYRLHAPI